MLRLLFVCVENANRSQLAEAFARMFGGDKVHAESAGSKPSGQVHPRAIKAMADLGYDLTTHRSKGLDEVGPGPWDYVITMGCGDECPYVPSKGTLDWGLPDPADLVQADYNRTRDHIARLVGALLEEEGVIEGYGRP